MKLPKGISRVLKWVLFSGAVTFLIYRVKEQSEDIPFGSLSVFIWPLVAAIALVPVNWGFEILKWKILTASFSPQTSGQATKAVLTGVFFGLFTPNRLGDVAGKVAALPKDKRPDGSYAFVIGSMAQAMATMLAASVALPLAAGWFAPPLRHLLSFLLIAMPCALMVLAWIYIRCKVPSRWLKWFFPSFEPEKHSRPVPKTQALVFLFSALRYAVFSTQFVLCLLAFQTPIEVFEVWILIAVVYLFSSFVPSAVLGELGIRESVALVLIAPIAGPGSELQVVLATFSLWIINLMLPGLAGAFLFFGMTKSSANQTPKHA